MALYKICDCGNIMKFDTIKDAPRKCDRCPRSLIGRTIYDEEETPIELPAEEGEPVSSEYSSAGKRDAGAEDDTADRVRFYLVSETRGFAIEIPADGGMVGRERGNIGEEILADILSISRNHLKVHYRGAIGLVIEDVSTYGTSLNGRVMLKNKAELARAGDEISLCKEAVIVKTSPHGKE